MLNHANARNSENKWFRNETVTLLRSYGCKVHENQSDDAAFWHALADQAYWLATKVSEDLNIKLGEILFEALNSGATVVYEQEKCTIVTSFGTSQYEDDLGCIEAAIKRWDQTH